MSTLGTTLRNAREAKGLTVAQVADATHIMPQIVEELERETFSRIVAPIYGRGFLKLICETLEIADPKPLVDEFMILYSNRNNAPKPVVSTPIPPERTSPDPVAAPSDPLSPSPVNVAEPPAADAINFATETDDADRLPRRRPDYRLPGHSMMDVPRSFWRFALLAAGAIVFIVILVVAGRVAYRASMGIPAEPEASAETATAPRDANVALPQVPSKRKGVKIPPLYMD